ncbi:MAG: DUF5689 domain-containing protein [Verrucomicrobiota bacterium]|jgi:hypothetical protein
MKNNCLLVGFIISTAALSAANALASDAATIFGDTSGTVGVTYDNASGSYPVITAILSQPGTVNGKTYTSWAFLAADSTGSLELYGALPSGTTFTPAVGDAISAIGTYDPYHQVPEIETLTGITLQSTGSTVPPAQVQTVSALNQATLPQTIAGSLVQLNNVTISGQTAGETFGPGTASANDLTLTVADSTGSMSFYYDPTVYSVASANLDGETIPTGPVDVVGVDSVYDGAGEFIPISIQPVPEPMSLSLGAAGGLLALVLHWRRKA